MIWRVRRMAREAARGLAMGVVLLLLVLALAWLGLAELLVAGLRRMQRDRLGLWSNRLLRLAQRLTDGRERIVAAGEIALEG